MRVLRYNPKVFCKLHYMKKIEQKTTTSWGREITLTVDENLNKLKGRILAPKKLEEANKHLRKMKSLPK